MILGNLNQNLDRVVNKSIIIPKYRAALFGNLDYKERCFYSRNPGLLANV